MPTQTAWEKTKTGGKAGFDKLWGWADKLGAPVNRWTNKIGSEAFWPTDIAKESDKAARILRSFCSEFFWKQHQASYTNTHCAEDGFYEDEVKTTDDGPKMKQRVLKKIPTEVSRISWRSRTQLTRLRSVGHQERQRPSDLHHHAIRTLDIRRWRKWCPGCATAQRRVVTTVRYTSAYSRRWLHGRS